MSTKHLDGMPCLVLNADMQPLRTAPLEIWPWHEAVSIVYKQKAIVVEEYDHIVRSPSTEMFLPSVIALKDYVHVDQNVKFTRYNVFLRDKFTCQYCGTKPDICDLTFDHVWPASKGGGTNWENIVTCCSPCNLKKSDKTLAQVSNAPYFMHLKHPPYIPNHEQFRRTGRVETYHKLHETWLDYLYWDSEIDKT